MNCNDIVESSGLVLYNLNANASGKGTWSTPSSSYAFYNVPYTESLVVGHWYYHRFTYKYATSNQKPTWSAFYQQGGSYRTANISNPQPNKEYVASGVYQPRSNASLTSGNLYNGSSNAINGVKAQAKDVLTYDITGLRTMLLTKGITDIKGWCDSNLGYVTKGVPFFVTPLYHSSITYNASQCTDYSNRNNTVGWSSEIKEGRNKWVVGDVILLSIPCDNGTHYISYQEIASLTALRPLHVWWISNRAEEGTIALGSTKLNNVNIAKGSILTDKFTETTGNLSISKGSLSVASIKEENRTDIQI